MPRLRGGGEDVKRYDMSFATIERDDGDWCRYEDVAAEVERLLVDKDLAMVDINLQVIKVIALLDRWKRHASASWKVEIIDEALKVLRGSSFEAKVKRAEEMADQLREYREDLDRRAETVYEHAMRRSQEIKDGK